MLLMLTCGIISKQIKSTLKISVILFSNIEVTTDNPPNQQSALCVCCSQSFLRI